MNFYARSFPACGKSRRVKRREKNVIDEGTTAAEASNLNERSLSFSVCGLVGRNGSPYSRKDTFFAAQRLLSHQDGFFLPLFHSAGFSHKERRQLGRNINLRLRKNTGSAWEMQEGNGMGQGHFGKNENRLLFLPHFSSGGKRENYHCSTSPFPSAISFLPRTLTFP